MVSLESLRQKTAGSRIDILDEYGTGISLVMLDILMPVTDGFEVLAYMNKNHIIDDVPVIMISCADSEAYIRRAYGLGVVDYISRPFDSKIVYQRVTKHQKAVFKTAPNHIAHHETDDGKRAY